MKAAKDLKFLFDPASIAVVGASDEPGKISSIIMDSILASNYGGRLYPINPAHSSVKGLECFPSIQAIGSVVDLAIFAVPAALVPGLIKDAAGNLKGAIVVSGGFGEGNGAGRAVDKELRDVIKKYKVRVVGPNCMGIYDAVSGLDTFFISPERIKRPVRGGISILSQSGSFALTAMDELAAEGLGVARVVSYGNMIDVNETDCLDFLTHDKATEVVVLYIESVEDGRRFVESASRCSRQKQVMALKAGRAGAGISAALLHTGALAGRFEIYRAAFKKASIIEINGYEEFIEGCKVLTMQKRSAGKRVIIITDGGGVGVAVADACVVMGLDVAPLPKKIKETLGAGFPGFVALGNPLDLTGSATDKWYADSLTECLKGVDYDLAIVCALWGPPSLTDALAELLAKSAGAAGKPVVICSPGGDYTRARKRLFEDKGLPVFSTPEAAVRAASVLTRG